MLAAVALCFVKPCTIFFARIPFSHHTSVVTTDFVSWWQKLKIDQTQRCTNTQTKGTVQRCTTLFTLDNTEQHSLQHCSDTETKGRCNLGCRQHLTLPCPTMYVTLYSTAKTTLNTRFGSLLYRIDQGAELCTLQSHS